MVIEPLFNNGKTLPNMNDINLLHHYDSLLCYQIIIFVQVVNDTAPWYPGLRKIQARPQKSVRQSCFALVARIKKFFEEKYLSENDNK